MLKNNILKLSLQEKCGKIHVKQSIFWYFKWYFRIMLISRSHLNVISICLHNYLFGQYDIGMIYSLLQMSVLYPLLHKWICMKLYTSLYRLIIYVNVRVQLVYSKA